ncbi:hypothetical protein BT63DRAFT_427673 [Microthyrium microscopicum]|uniref:CsbD-like domain-containing protein n=1 Tax=Microthyrium microscopicum TaxID=703497 RepID=A0A6A6U4K0_9PEZI|nr:hypothetical protein BT63DRAFT_427673 [Microthyrium microscopicum]
MSDKNTAPSTVGAYVDQAIGAAQSVISSITGNPADQAKADEHKASAALEKDASHATAKAGPFTLSSSGAVAQDSTDRTEGSWDQTVGSAKAALGGAIGHEGLKQAGDKQYESGKAQEAKGQLNDLGSGVGDRVTGAIGSTVAGITGNTAEQAKRQAQHDQGKSLQRGVEADLQKQVDAEQKKDPAV